MCLHHYHWKTKLPLKKWCLINLYLTYIFVDKAYACWYLFPSLTVELLYILILLQVKHLCDTSFFFFFFLKAIDNAGNSKVQIEVLQENRNINIFYLCEEVLLTSIVCLWTYTRWYKNTPGNDRPQKAGKLLFFSVCSLQCTSEVIYIHRAYPLSQGVFNTCGDIIFFLRDC